jgi:hypothetical protein
MNVMKIPVIIRKNIKAYNNNYYLETSKNLVNLEMVELANNYYDLLEFSKKVLLNESNINDKQFKAYSNYFGDPNSLSDVISLDM